ncbi:MAG TPA: zeta toxin family protein [Longimicrobium sp.]
MSREAEERPSIYVVAGTNGAGKSSVAGALFRKLGTNYFNPDEAARRILETNPDTDLSQANSEAWLLGKRLLENAIASRTEFAFETTLGGNTIPLLLEQAADEGMAVQILYVGLDSPELHIARVKARVKAGGHDIPEGMIRERYRKSRENLLRLLPRLAGLRMFDNSAESDPRTGGRPKPRLILSMSDGKIEETCDVADVPDWAKPIFVAAFRTFGI